MRSFHDGDVLTIEPWRAGAFPVIKDLMVDRSAFDRIIAAGGFVSVRTGNAPDANAVPVPKDDADLAMDAAACIGCGACVAACPNASAMLFVAAKVSHLNLLPQGQPERYRRVLAMVDQMDAEGFGGCTNHGECEAACPKEIGVHFISMLNRDLPPRQPLLAPARPRAVRTGEDRGPVRRAAGRRWSGHQFPASRAPQPDLTGFVTALHRSFRAHRASAPAYPERRPGRSTPRGRRNTSRAPGTGASRAKGLPSPVVRHRPRPG